jgi:hypothetical protein
MPANGSTAELLRLLITEEEAQLQGFHDPNVRKGARSRKGLGRVPTVQRTAETSEVVALRGHEQMFA